MKRKVKLSKNHSLNVATLLGLLIIFLFCVYSFYSGKLPEGDLGIVFDGLFFSMIIILLYFNFEKLNQTLTSYSMIIGLIGVHLLSALFFYGLSWGVLEFDMIMHFLGGIVLSVLIFYYLLGDFKEKPLKLMIITVLCVLGLSVIHEIIEFFGYNFLEGGSGIFMYGKGDFGEYNDISWDLISNLLGSALAVLGLTFGRGKNVR